MIETQDTTAPAAISGWADVVTSQTVGSGTTLTRLTVRWRRAVAGDSAPTVPASTNHTISRILGIRGVDTGATPWNITSSGINATSNTSVSIPGATTTVDECLVVAVFSTGTDTATAQLSGSFANSSLANIATQINDWTLSGGGGGIAVCTGEFAVKGAYGATTATLVTASVKAYMTVALAPTASTGQAQTKWNFGHQPIGVRTRRPALHHAATW